jgi:hypothetical protein
MHETFNVAIASGEKPTHRSLIKAETAAINRHPALQNLVSWLVLQALEKMNQELAFKHELTLSGRPTRLFT